MPRLVVAGASGFIGQQLVRVFGADGWDVRTIGRSSGIPWSAVSDAVDGADVLVNLAGRSVNCRYTERNRAEILNSRVDTTRALHVAVAAAASPPRVWLNASTATIYRHEIVRPNTEADGVLGAGFSVDVAREWERALFSGELPATRRIALRMAIVLGDGPAVRTLATLARIGLGGPHIDGPWPAPRRTRGIGPTPTGDGLAAWHDTRGGQRFSWVHLDDVVRAIRFLIDRADVSGPVNVAAPHPSDDRTLMRTLRRIVGAPVGLPAHRWMLEPAMWMLRTEPELVLKSRWVVPDVLERARFRFRHPDLEEALREAVSRGRPRLTA